MAMECRSRRKMTRHAYVVYVVIMYAYVVIMK